MRIWTARNKFVGTNFRTWLFTIAFNLVKNHYRHAEHQQHYEQFLALHQAVTEDSNVVETLDGEAFIAAFEGKAMEEDLPLADTQAESEEETE